MSRNELFDGNVKRYFWGNWIKVDFANWRDEDESEEEDDKTRDLEKMMSQMGGGMGGGMGKRKADGIEEGRVVRGWGLGCGLG